MRKVSKRMKRWRELKAISPEKRTYEQSTELARLARRMRRGFLGWRNFIWNIKMLIKPTPAIKELRALVKESKTKNHYAIIDDSTGLVIGVTVTFGNDYPDLPAGEHAKLITRDKYDEIIKDW